MGIGKLTAARTKALRCIRQLQRARRIPEKSAVRPRDTVRTSPPVRVRGTRVTTVACQSESPVSPLPGAPPGCTRRGCAHPPRRCSSPSATGPPSPAHRRRGEQLPVGAVGVHQRVVRWTWRPLPPRRDPWTRWAMRGWRRMTSLLGAQLRANQSSLGRPVDLRVRMRSPVSGATPPYVTYVRRKQGRVPDRPTGCLTHERNIIAPSSSAKTFALTFVDTSQSLVLSQHPSHHFTAHRTMSLS